MCSELAWQAGEHFSHSQIKIPLLLDLSIGNA